MQTENHCSEHPNGSLHGYLYDLWVRYSQWRNVSPSNCTSANNGKRSGSNHCDRRYIRNTSSTISFRYYTSISRKCIRKRYLNGFVDYNNNTNVTPITTGPISVDARNVTIAANTPTGAYTVTYTICESVDTANGANVSPALYISYGNGKRSGSNHCDRRYIRNSISTISRYHTSIGRKQWLGNDTKRTCRNDKQYECYPNHDGTNFSWCRRKRNHCSEHNGSLHGYLYHLWVSRYTAMAPKPMNCTSATVTVNVVGQIIATILGTPVAPLASGTYTSSSRRVWGNDTLNGLCRNATIRMLPQSLRDQFQLMQTET
jgi:hypothetical protein